jgi:hypothetical protein
VKALFPEYEEHGKEYYDDAWKHGLFVFDTNVLLNFYRYQVPTRNELINVLTQLSDRVWIPHYVALEFQRKRLKVIAQQSRRFSEVQNTITNIKNNLIDELNKLQLQKRHSLIDPQPLTSAFDNLVAEFLSTLEALREKQQKLSDPDPFKEKIEALFDGHVGDPPKDQDQIDKIYKDAAYRYERKIPPGYMDKDKDKDKDEPPEFLHRNIIYKRKYGDFLIWKQIIDYAKSKSVKQLIFVTDDGKEDWWRKLEFDGPKTIGPRPELVGEAHSLGSIENFLMYNPEGFLKYAREFLKTPVSEETIKDVRDTTSTRTFRAYILSKSNLSNITEYAVQAEQLVSQWLMAVYGNVEENRFGFPDFIVRKDGNKVGFGVKVADNAQTIKFRLKDVFFRAYYELKESGFDQVAIVIVTTGLDDVEEIKRRCLTLLDRKLSYGLRIIIGVIENDSFVPMEDFIL